MKRKKMKKHPTKPGLPRHVDRLYKAVAHYVKKCGGNLVVIGGIQVQEWPGDAHGKFTIGIPCLGRKPQYAAPNAAVGESTKEKT